MQVATHSPRRLSKAVCVCVCVRARSRVGSQCDHTRAWICEWKYPSLQPRKECGLYHLPHPRPPPICLPINSIREESLGPQPPSHPVLDAIWARHPKASLAPGGVLKLWDSKQVLRVGKVLSVCEESRGQRPWIWKEMGAVFWLCDLGQVSVPLWASHYLP